MMRLRNQMVLYITLYIAIPFLIFASIAIYFVYDASIKQEQEHFTRNIDNLSMEMSQYLGQIETSLHIFANNSTIVTASANDKHNLMGSFYGQMKDVVNHVFITDKTGRVTAIYPENSSCGSDCETINTTFKNDEWFTNIKKDKESHLSDLVNCQIDNHPTNFIADPLFNPDGTFAGVVGVALTFEKAQTMIHQKGYDHYSYLLLDTKGNVLVSEGINDEDNSSLIPFIKSTVKDPNNTFTIKEVNFNNDRQYMTTSPLPKYPYAITALVPKEQFLAPVHKLQIQFFIWILFTILSVSLVGYLIRRSIILPIETFLKMTKKISTEATTNSLSALNETTHIKNKGELSELSEHFNTMMINLKNRDERLYKQRTNLIQTIVELLEVNDAYTAGHSYRVYRYSSLIASQLNLSKEKIQDIETAALLHDIGKIGIPQEIINKPNKLNAKEYDLIKEHPVIGAQVLERIDDFEIIRNAVLYHHEHYNGDGYPNQKSGEKIPLVARIISVADAFDAMTTNRPYRSGMTIEQAYLIIMEESAKQFDPLIVEAFSNIYNNNIELLEEVQKTQQFRNIALLAN